MDNRLKSKSKKWSTDKSKQSKKKKNEGPTCSTFLSQLTRKFMSKKKQPESSCDIVHSIIDSLTNTLPIQLKTPNEKESPLRIESLKRRPELIQEDIIEMPRSKKSYFATPVINLETTHSSTHYQTPEMPIIKSEELQVMKPKIVTKDIAVFTVSERDIAGEITKHVATLRKISLIAEEFNKKTAKNLKEIVDSVQQDLIKKLEEVKAEQRANSVTSEKQLEIK